MTPNQIRQRYERRRLLFARSEQIKRHIDEQDAIAAEVKGRTEQLMVKEERALLGPSPYRSALRTVIGVDISHNGVAVAGPFDVGGDKVVILK